MKDSIPRAITKPVVKLLEAHPEALQKGTKATIKATMARIKEAIHKHSSKSIRYTL